MFDYRILQALKNVDFA